MKFLHLILLCILIGIVWSTASLIKNAQIEQLIKTGKIPYGPIPNFKETSYTYVSVSPFSSKLELNRANEFTKNEFEQLVSKSLDPIARKKFKKYLLPTLRLSNEYQVDPFWIISIMMVESSFETKAESHKNAHGLMQIRPETLNHLNQLMRKKLTTERPTENIEAGIFYLKKLLQNFRMNHRLATIAYNIGPSKLKNSLHTQRINTNNFSYYLKVQKIYNKLSKNFALELKNRPRPFELTYIALLGSENLKQSSSHSLPF